MQAADSACIPYGSVSTGVVTALQQGTDGLPLVLHSASISEGNSGGPLVDYCGRAVGMNTFGRRDVDRLQQINFAQQATAIGSFLISNSIVHEVEETGCALVPTVATTTETSGATATGELPADPADVQAEADTPAPDASLDAPSAPAGDGAASDEPLPSALTGDAGISEPPTAPPAAAGNALELSLD
jgi:S1-C subfamily serine protease